MTSTVQPQDPDEQLLEHLADVYHQLDPVPDLVSESARAVFGLRDLDAELVPLVEQAAGTLVRGEPDGWVSFALDGLEIDLGSRRERHGWQIVGQVTGAIRELSVHTLAGAEPLAVDEHGRFSAAVSARTLSLRLTTSDGRRLRTQWVSL